MRRAVCNFFLTWEEAGGGGRLGDGGWVFGERVLRPFLCRPENIFSLSSLQSGNRFLHRFPLHLLPRRRLCLHSERGDLHSEDDRYSVSRLGNLPSHLCIYFVLILLLSPIYRRKGVLYGECELVERMSLSFWEMECFLCLSVDYSFFLFFMLGNYCF